MVNDAAVLSNGTDLRHAYASSASTLGVPDRTLDTALAICAHALSVLMGPPGEPVGVGSELSMDVNVNCLVPLVVSWAFARAQSAESATNALMIAEVRSERTNEAQKSLNREDESTTVNTSWICGAKIGSRGL